MDVGIAKHQILKYNFGIDPEGSLGLVLSLKIGILLVTIFEIFDQNWPFYVLMVSFYFYALFFRPSYLNLHITCTQTSGRMHWMNPALFAAHYNNLSVTRLERV